jgi:signal transduction histidine kinase
MKGFGAQNLLRRDVADHPYRIIFEKMLQAAVTLSVDGTVLDCNPAFASLLQSRLADISGRPFTGWLDQECCSSWNRIFENRSEPCRWDLRLLREDGARIPMRATVTGLDPRAGMQARCVIVFDMPDGEGRVGNEADRQSAQLTKRTVRTESAELNRRLFRINRRLAARYLRLRQKAHRLNHADAMKTRFLSNISHEFRNPLNSIFGLTSLLLYRGEGELNAEQHKLVGYIRRAADSLLELVDDLLDLSKIEAEKISVHPTEFDVGEMLITLRGMLIPSLLAPAVRLIFEAPKDLSRLYSDEGKISQILQNFVTNAVKFTESGEIRVSTCHDHDNDQAIFSVTDTGIGIAPEDQEKIFEEFTQLASPVQGRAKGSGVGLFVCRRLATLLGGRITLESILGSGSKFSLAVPCRYDPVRETRQGEPLTRLPSREQREPAPQSAHDQTCGRE